MLDRFAHYLRSPLTSIKGAASVLKQTQVNIDEDSKQELIGIINDESERLNKIVDKLLWIIRIEAGKIQIKYEKTNLLLVIEAVIEKLGGILKKNQVSINMPTNLPLIELDSEFIEQSLFYLLENAAKFSPTGSEILLNVCQNQDKVKISIVDKGIGIEESEQKEIFSKFYRPLQQLDQLPGVGMSLAICQGLINAHNGTIELRSKLKQGTTIDIELPISANNK